MSRWTSTERFPAVWLQHMDRVQALLDGMVAEAHAAAAPWALVDPTATVGALAFVPDPEPDGLGDFVDRTAAAWMGLPVARDSGDLMEMIVRFRYDDEPNADVAHLFDADAWALGCHTHRRWEWTVDPDSPTLLRSPHAPA